MIHIYVTITTQTIPSSFMRQWFSKGHIVKVETMENHLRMNELGTQLDRLIGCVVIRNVWSWLVFYVFNALIIYLILYLFLFWLLFTRVRVVECLEVTVASEPESDDSRTSERALLFINRGFPFVSIMDGGFAAANSWLRENCPLLESLVITDTHRSILSVTSFASTSSRTVQKLLDSSIIVLTLS